MRLSLIALLAVMAGVSPGFAASASLTGGETRYACGKSCPETQLVCGWEVKPAPAGLTLQAMINEDMLPWGQMDYWVGAGVVADRQDGEDIVDGKRVAEPVIVSFGGLDWVRADYDIETKDGRGLGASVLIWSAGDGVALLRCSFRTGSDAAGAIEELALGLRE